MRAGEAAIVPILAPGETKAADVSADGSFAAMMDVAQSIIQAESIASETEPAPAAGPDIDFPKATRRELFDWMNAQILAGKMTIEESTPFLGMTLRLSAATGRPVDMDTDDTRFDFIERVQGGIAFALERFDYDGADRLRTALETMEQWQATRD